MAYRIMLAMDYRISAKERKRLLHHLVVARKYVGLNQTDAARKLGKTQTYLSKIEVGQRKIDVLELKQLAKLYHKLILYFLR